VLVGVAVGPRVADGFEAASDQDGEAFEGFQAGGVGVVVPPGVPGLRVPDLGAAEHADDFGVRVGVAVAVELFQGTQRKAGALLEVGTGVDQAAVELRHRGLVLPVGGDEGARHRHLAR